MRRYGRCQVCSAYGPVVLHHLLKEQEVRRATSKEQQEVGIVWDLRNALLVGAPYFRGGKCRCHDRHTTPVKTEDKIPYGLVSQDALEYAIEILGPGPAENYWKRYYRDAP